MFSGTDSSTGNMPAASAFQTPRPVNHRNRTSIRGRSGQSCTSSESLSGITHSGANSSSSSSAQSRLSQESVNRETHPLETDLTTQTSRSQHLEDNVPSVQNYNSDFNYVGNQFVSYSSDSQHHYSHSALPETTLTNPEPGVFYGREVLGTGAMSHGYAEYRRKPVDHHPHLLLTDAAKLRQFDRHSSDGFAQWASDRQTVLDVGQGQNSGHQGTSSQLSAQRGHHSFDSSIPRASEPMCYLGSSHDLTAWLQQHKHHLRQQQGHSLSSLSHGHYASAESLVDSTDKVEMLKQAADDIIRVKDHIIERQKAKILQFETNAVKSRFGSALNSDFRATNEQILEKKLGATEYELRETKQLFENNLREKDNAISSLKDELKRKNLIISELETKCLAKECEAERLQKQIDSQNRYLKALPTAEEHSDNLRLVHSVKEENLKLIDTVTQLEKELEASTNDLKSRDSLLRVLEDSNKDMKCKLQDFEASNKTLLGKLSAKVDLQEIQQLQRDNKRLNGELDKARKLMDVLNNRLQQLTATHRSEMTSQREQLDQEAAAVTALQQEVKDKEQLLKNYRQTIRETTAENQNLTEEKMKLEDELKELNRPDRAEELQLQQQLFKDLSVSLGDLQKLVKVCLEKTDGQDPNLAHLLGIKDYIPSDQAESITHLGTAVSVSSVKSQLSQARNLRHEIDKLREIIADKFAEDMGRRLTCNPQ